MTSSSPWPKILFAQRTDSGRDPHKQVNEDSADYRETHLGHLLVVCDGMGGHALGQEASSLAVSTVVHEVEQAPRGTAPADALRNAIRVAGRKVFAFGGEEPRLGRPGSTCVSLLIHPGGTEIAHVGDSRAYVVRNGKLWPLTRDHSMVQQLVDAGLLRPEDASGHPDSNKITRALGMQAEADVEVRPDPILHEAGDLFLLVTDGVTDVLQDSDLLAIATLGVETRASAAICEQIVTLANARGGPDNITVQAAFVMDAGIQPQLVAARAARITQIDEGLAQGHMPEEGALVPVTAHLASGPHDNGLRASEQGQGSASGSAPQQTGASTTDALGKSGTVRLAVVPAASPSGRKAPAPTVIDIASDATMDAAPEPLQSGSVAGVSRKRRMALGLVLLCLGGVVGAGSCWLLFFNDEAPAPVIDAHSIASSSP